MKQKRDRYEMHKYWGKKPSNNLKALIEKYSSEEDTLLEGGYRLVPFMNEVSSE